MDNIIESQKQYADSLLKTVENFCPSAIIAGGAPRDWYYGRPASDIDVFVYLGNHLTQREIISIFTKSGFKIKTEKTGEGIPEHYKRNPNLKTVIEVEGEFPTQIMIMSKPTYDCVVSLFPLSICKVWYKNGRIKTDIDFDVCNRHKIIVVTNNLYNNADGFITKIRKKYPDFKFYDSWEKAFKEIK